MPWNKFRQKSALLWIAIMMMILNDTGALTYHYFGYGSNVLPSTMKALRQIEVRRVTAAVLPDYELEFASAAYVQKTSQTETTTKSSRKPVVHGLLYTLTKDEFAKVGLSEGVPFGYKWQSCQVYPYRGDGNEAGSEALYDTSPVQAYTLVGLTQQQPTNNAPPSESYLRLIREGARLWRFDRSYQEDLANMEVAKNIKNSWLFPATGWEGPTLELAEKVTGIERTYMIDGYDS
mmetsp:Transcript_4530/g.6529  ORF Transcript_4530/g.6529 Transcript_4530/m.6529 type:complete len:234 (+) Transcript_4530:171-872(+)